MDYLGCTEESQRERKPCNRDLCRYWMNFEEDLNCSLIAVENNGPMTLEDIAKRLNITLVRVKQIQDEAILKMKKRILPLLNE